MTRGARSPWPRRTPPHEPARPSAIYDRGQWRGAGQRLRATHLERRNERHDLTDEFHHGSIITVEVAEHLSVRGLSTGGHGVGEGLTSLVDMRTIMTTAPTTTLRRAEAWLARLAASADRAPMRFPTRADAATPIPKGMVFMTGQHVMSVTDTRAR